MPSVYMREYSSSSWVKVAECKLHGDAALVSGALQFYFDRTGEMLQAGWSPNSPETMPVEALEVTLGVYDSPLCGPSCPADYR